MINARILLVGIVGLLLFACSSTLSKNEREAINSTELNTTLQFFDRFDDGPVYDVSMTLPADWVGEYELRNQGNAIYFDRVDQFNQQTQVLSIEALSADQYWKMSGSYPNSHTNIVNKGDTYFVYYLPIDSYYTGMSEEEMAAFSASVPALIDSFVANTQ
jgi:hypothetical protein